MISDQSDNLLEILNSLKEIGNNVTSDLIINNFDRHINYMKLTSDTEDVFICRVYNDLNQILFGQGQITITSKTCTKSQILNNHHTKYQGLASCDSVESFFFNDRVSFIIFVVVEMSLSLQRPEIVTFSRVPF